MKGSGNKTAPYIYKVMSLLYEHELHLQKLDTIFGGAIFYVKILKKVKEKSFA